ncbi:DUF397 domain-containing protein [Amycolatopsis anabasis]|uniref:DUF397 domain-containing protein n=1 Tax=Amycolatopsis anabasis TaxID=1840409 RepID=UPI001FE5D0AA|nr:DUF397 domain-containing protein [Amycolatopsis anabasis]
MWHSVMIDWRTSSYTHYEENACVEVGATRDLIGVRDTKQAGIPAHARPVLVFTRRAFRAFVEGLKAG